VGTGVCPVEYARRLSKVIRIHGHPRQSQWQNQKTSGHGSLPSLSQAFNPYDFTKSRRPNRSSPGTLIAFLQLSDLRLSDWWQSKCASLFVPWIENKFSRILIRVRHSQPGFPNREVVTPFDQHHSGPNYPARIRRPECPPSERDRRCARLLRHNLPGQIM